jgi:hypothetical protein
MASAFYSANEAAHSKGVGKMEVDKIEDKLDRARDLLLITRFLIESAEGALYKEQVVTQLNTVMDTLSDAQECMY